MKHTEENPEYPFIEPMRHKQLYFHIIFFLILTYPVSTFAQSWDFVKKKDDILIYSRKESEKNLKSFKGVTEIKEPAEKVFALIEDVNNTDWWDKNLNQIKVLLYEKNKRAQYYLVYNLPWPFKDRDLCVNVTTTIDPVTGVSKITAVPLSGIIPLQDGLVRIKDYRQVWTVKPAGKNLAHVELEFYVDPADNLPDWLLNMLLTNSPINSINGIRKHLEHSDNH